MHLKKGLVKIRHRHTYSVEEKRLQSACGQKTVWPHTVSWAGLPSCTTPENLLYTLLGKPK